MYLSIIVIPCLRVDRATDSARPSLKKEVEERHEAAMAPKQNGVGVRAEDAKLCVVMVGLPARGKSYIAQKGE